MEAARKHADNNTISQQPKRGFFSSNKLVYDILLAKTIALLTYLVLSVSLW